MFNTLLNHSWSRCSSRMVDSLPFCGSPTALEARRLFSFHLEIAEHAANIGAANKGKKRSAGTKARISRENKGKELSAKHTGNIGATNKGKKRSAKIKAKISTEKALAW